MNEREVALQSIYPRPPLPRLKVARPSLPLPTEVRFNCFRGLDDSSVRSVHGRIKPPHVGWDVWVASRETNQKCGPVSVKSRRQLPVWKHNARHTGLIRHVVRISSLDEIRLVSCYQGHVPTGRFVLG